ncbi:DNA polymerase III subunit delta [Sneathiella glossodoripedis]|uniref:DNA polymerase III subunit delta n=1 Tax=Sneathiella glossodoripedis TaxID=418853 RepID=UPI000472A117|nr:DNA polymerase III subunit delta [Sneathiella glossodoripedis]
MEFRSGQIKAFFNTPDKTRRVFLIYGQDEGLVREYGKKIALTAVASLDDPFCYSELDATSLSDDPARLRDEIEAISMMGGERVVRLRNVSNAHAKLITNVLDADFSNTLLICEAGDLKKTAALVKAVNSLNFGAIIACYRDKSQDILSLINEILGGANIPVPTDVLEYLKSSLGSDRAISRQELEKLQQYKGNDTSPLTLQEVKSIVGDNSAESVFDVIDATLFGDLPKLEYAIDKAFFAGESAITFLRLAQNQLKQLHKAAAFISKGTPANIAVKKAGIAPFNQQKALAQIGRKTAAHFAQCLDIILQAEIECKKTGMPAETFCRRALLRVAMANRR